MNEKDCLDPNTSEGVCQEISPTLVSRGLALSRRTFTSFQHPLFRFYYAAFISQTVAMNMQFIARSLLIYRLTDSATILGLMSLTYALPMLLISYYGGFLADRYSKRNIMLVGYCVFTLMATSIGVAIRTGYLGTEHGDSWWLLMVASAIQGIFVAFTIPAQQSYVAELVPGKQVQNAVSLNQMAMNAMRMIGPAIAGFVIEFAGFDIVFFIGAAFYLLGIVSLLFLPAIKHSVKKVGSTLNGLKEGFSYIRRDATIMMILVAGLLVFMLAMPYFTLLPIFADDVLKVGASGMGLLLTFNGIGALIGSLVMANLPPRNRGRIFLWSIFSLSIGVIALSFSTNWVLSLSVMVLIGTMTALFSAAANSLLLNYTLSEYHGRVMSIYMMQTAFISLGATLAGALADSAGGVQWAIGGMAITLTLLAVIGLVTFARIKQLA